MKLNSLLFEQFKVANSGRYFEKMSFYKIKPFILEQYGEYIGYDIQVISIKCKYCYGTGYLRGVGKCPHCTKGLYSHKVYYLKKYLLNGEFFHVPTESQPKSGNKISTIKGKIEHEAIHPSDSYKALITLLSVYDKQELNKLLKYSLSVQKYYEAYNKEIQQLIKNLEVKDAA